ncbi:ADP-ribosylation_factor [Hexamita inflata]|uniref:ADP-ribosylation factor n=1 Tax=Hexamita inflata TaxID=28002 RepID=A0AA86NRL2_9EUKA|nr:ADP-ribosylation factor [Hexamita inflata]
MLGLDGAGKTQLLYRLKTKKYMITNPTIGFNVETIYLQHKRPVTVWDVGGQKRLRFLWIHYLQNTQLVMYIIDSTDRDFARLQQCRYELHKLLHYQELDNIPFMILFNKNDLPNAMNDEEIQENFNLSVDLQYIVTTHKILVIKTTAASNKSVQDIIKKLKNVIIEQQK